MMGNNDVFVNIFSEKYLKMMYIIYQPTQMEKMQLKFIFIYWLIINNLIGF